MIDIYVVRITVILGLLFSWQSLEAPPTLAASAAEEGRQVYNTYCVLCHGTNLINAGTNAPDLRKFPKSQKSRFIGSVRNGKGQGKMPAWGDILSTEQISKIWSYVKTRGKI